MKKEYVKPAMESEVFISNEYVAACYSGKCDVNCGDYFHWHDLDKDGRVDRGEIGHWVTFGNNACKAEFNEKGSIYPVAWEDDGGEWRTGYFFVAETPKDGHLSTHVSSSTTKTNASQ